MAVLSQLYVHVISRGFADVNRQVNALSQAIRQANGVSNQMQQATARIGAGGGGMAQAAASAGVMSRAVAAVGPALAALAAPLAAVAAGWKLVRDGMQGTTELYRLGFAYQQFARTVAGLFAPVFNGITTAWQNITNQIQNSPNLRAALYWGLIAPMQIFIKLVEGIRITFALAEAILKVGAAFLRVNLGAGALKAWQAGGQQRQVTLNQTGEESGQGTFQRIQEAIYKLSVPKEDSPVEGLLREIDGHIVLVEAAINKLGGFRPPDAEALVRQHVDPFVAPFVPGLMGVLGIAARAVGR